MNYNIRITALRDRHAKLVVAQQLARENGVPLQQALAMADRLPLTLRGNVDKGEVAARLRQYGKIGIEAQAIEVSPVPKSGSGPAPLPQPPQRAAPSTSAGAAAVSPSGGVTGEKRLIVKGPVTFARETTRKRRFTAELGRSVAVAAFIALVAAGLILTPRATRHFSPQRSPITRENGAAAVDGSAKAVAQAPAESGAERLGDAPAARDSAESARAQAYADSAQVQGNDTESAVHFYKMAIAFNRYNLHAWYGLLNAYQATGRSAQAQATREQMKRLFGKNAFSVERLLQPLGTL